eukprot:CAMPEP_0195037912 /NCGR_PEP_ID=MMETSP0326_2-20130528/76094_1 /TAXON_ID=2866 ORGANISM="Crypthecodinium cohnii, Strain Seligo" /NCGR_SAMPLE_ID=MMETSP0326_2 /ASSEMBLY_ACC=CAM_ASM_000348 /LENGTH=58 /DNA_ID=CAMNT_0040064141 /DNA_START=151 /DNA_END=323 /DNA_ORIENTATION=-
MPRHVNGPLVPSLDRKGRSSSVGRHAACCLMASPFVTSGEFVRDFKVDWLPAGSPAVR